MIPRGEKSSSKSGMAHVVIISFETIYADSTEFPVIPAIIFILFGRLYLCNGAPLEGRPRLLLQIFQGIYLEYLP